MNPYTYFCICWEKQLVGQKFRGRSLSLLQIVFEAKVGASYDADIAIDDVVVTTGACPGESILDFSARL